MPPDLAAEDILGAKVDLDDLVPDFVRMFDRRFAQDGAGVVDQDIDARKIGLDLLDKRVQRPPVREVTSVPGEVAAQGGYLGLHLAAARLHGGADADDVRANLGQRVGHGAADAPPGASDQRGLAV
jgi:hypothetical protein